MAVTLEQFIDNLTKSGLMSSDEVAAEKDREPEITSDVEHFARHLVRRKKLTKYQAAAIYQGKVKHLRFGDYVVLDKIGAGGMGLVLKAEHRRMKRIVAVKVLPDRRLKDEAAVQRFYRETEAAARLNHPHIVTAYDAGEHEGLHYLVMEYVDGHDLATYVRDHGPLPIEQAVHCITQAAQGLQFAHEKGIIHRDIKPGNLLLDNEGAVKVLDMGLARFSIGIDEGTAPEELTQSGQIMGTIDYMAPEQATDTRKADACSDIYSLGCTLFRLLTGRAIYESDSVMNKLVAHREEPVPSLREARSDVPPGLDAVYQKMVAKSPGDRQQSMVEVIADLQSWRKPARPKLPPRPRKAATDPATTWVFQDTDSAKDRPTQTVHVAEPPTRRPATSDDAGDPLVASTADFAAPVIHATTPRHGHAGRSRKNGALLFVIFGGIAAVVLLIALVAILVGPDDTADSDLGGESVAATTGETEADLPHEDAPTNGPRGPAAETGNDGAAPPPADDDVESGGSAAPPKANAGGENNDVPAGLVPPETATPPPDDTPDNDGDDPPAVAPNGSPAAPSPAVAPFRLPQAQSHQTAWAEFLGLPVEKKFELPGGEKLTMILIPPGEFTMGSDDQEWERFYAQAKAAKEFGWNREWEKPLRVRIGRPFYLGKYEVTQSQWEAVMGNNPSEFTGDPSRPVECVSWDDVQPFLAKLNAASSQPKIRFVLPTEQQWEFACRAGTTTPWHCGDDEAVLQDYGWFPANSDGATHPVGRLKPNAFGLYDMHGNVFEICAGDPASTGRPCRGGAWSWEPRHGRSAYPNGTLPDGQGNIQGFRLAGEIAGAPDGGPPLPAAVAASPDDDKPAKESSTGSNVIRQLAGPTRFDFLNRPLFEVARFLQEKHGVQFWIERWALNEAGISANAPVTATSGDGTLAENLSAALESLDLTWTTEDELIVITTPEKAKGRLQTCVYKPMRPVDLDKLTDEIRTNIAPSNWATVGGYGFIKPIISLGALVVAQRAVGHHEIRRHYAGVLTLVEPPPQPPAGGRDPIQEALAQASSCDFRRTPLADALDQLGDRHGIRIGLHKRSLDDAGIASDVPITCVLSGVPLRTLLTVVLREVDLAWTVTQAGLIVMSPKEAKKTLELVAYEASDLAGDGDYSELIEAIQRTIAGDAWESVGGPGSIRGGVRGTLDVRQNYHVHREIEHLLAALRQAR